MRWVRAVVVALSIVALTIRANGSVVRGPEVVSAVQHQRTVGQLANRCFVVRHVYLRVAPCLPRPATGVAVQDARSGYWVPVASVWRIYLREVIEEAERDYEPPLVRPCAQLHSGERDRCPAPSFRLGGGGDIARRLEGRTVVRRRCDEQPTEIVILLGLARRTARKSRKYHHFTCCSCRTAG